MIITTLEIYRQMGVDLQDYYVQSMISDVFDFLKVIYFTRKETRNIINFFRSMRDWTSSKLPRGIN